MSVIKTSKYIFGPRYDFEQDRRAVDADLTAFFLALSRLQKYVLIGNGDPEGSVNGFIGSLFLRLDGSTDTTVYKKESGDGTNTGWVAIAAGGGGGTPGGSTTQVQFNDAGSFGGDAGLTYDKTTDSLTIASAGIIYFGDSSTNGSWRIRRSGSNLAMELREAGVWNEKSSATP